MPSIWFNGDTCSPGLDALGWYHEKRDDARNIGLGPGHDWSHGADAFGLMCVAYETPDVDEEEDEDERMPRAPKQMFGESASTIYLDRLWAEYPGVGGSTQIYLTNALKRLPTVGCKGG